MKRNSLLIAMLFVTLIAGAQSINLHMNNGEVIKYNSAEVDYIDFTESSDVIAYTSCPDNHHPHLINLGLPSGTKWACCNVGASKPEEYGSYFAWGETLTKSTYNWITYVHCDGSEETYHDIGKDIAGTQYDAATSNWGSPWAMPCLEQVNELKDKCTSEWTTENGVNGRRFIGHNGASVFFPAAGCLWDNDQSIVIEGAGWGGRYWLSTLFDLDSNLACFLSIYSGGENTSSDIRCLGLSVRPVCKK